MGRFFVPDECIDGAFVRITGEAAWHIARALRTAAGEHITVADMHGGVYDCVTQSISDALVEARILSSGHENTEPPYRAHVYQALPKGEKFDTVVQKAVELGAFSVTPFISSRCVCRPDAASLAKKCARWEKISESAAKQCGRAVIPHIGSPMTFEEVIKAAAGADIPVFCYEGDGTKSLYQRLSEYRNNTAVKTPDIAVIIGSEGGFSPGEAAAAASAGLEPTGLGKRILRTETASGFVLSCLSYELEERIRDDTRSDIDNEH